MNKKTLNKEELKWLISVPGKKNLYILLLTVIKGAVGGAGVLYALIMRDVIDSAVEGNVERFKDGMISIVILSLSLLLLRALIRSLNENARSSIENAFKARLLYSIIHGDHLKVSALHSGDWMNRMTGDTALIANDYVTIVPDLFEMIVKLISALVMIIMLEPLFAAFLIPCGMILILFSWLFRGTLKRLHKDIREKDGALRVFLQERISNMLMIRSFAAEDRTMEGAKDKMNEHRAARMRRTSFSNLCNMGFGTAMSGMYLIGLGWCGYGILKGNISFGTLTAITQLISQVQSPFANISGYLPKYYAMIASAERLMEAERLREDETECLTGQEIKAFYDGLETIGFKDVSFAYGDNAEVPAVLEKLTFSVKKGGYLAFTGQSGCGKSTVLKNLMCVYKPDSGERYYTLKNGERGNLTSKHRRLFAYVPQGNALMNGKIRDVVTFARTDIADDDEKFWNALKISCADGFVKELEEKGNTLLGERGGGLSEGQMQRIAIARAIFSEAPVLLLDESTSALDAETEKQLLNNLRSLTDKTVIIVTHRTAALSICDRVLEFTESGIEEKSGAM